MSQILIPDYPGQQVISGVRSLAREGDDVDLAWNLGPGARAFLSRRIRKYHAITSSRTDAVRYAREVAELACQQEYPVVLPFGLDSCSALVLHWPPSADTSPMLLPRREAFQVASDKLLTAKHCKDIGIEVPQVFPECSADDLKSIADSAQFPLVIKARQGSGVKEGLRYATNMSELRRAYEQVCGTGGSENECLPMIQEYVPGNIHDACTLSHTGTVVNILTQIRSVMSPIYGGVGALNITTDEPQLKALATRVLESLAWNGPAQIEFKFDPRDKKYKLIEINPKFWGTLDLSIKAGMSFVTQARDIILGRRVQRNQTYRVGVRYKFLFPQLTTSYIQRLRQHGLRPLGQRHSFVASYRDIDWSDPLPDAWRMAGTLWQLITRGTDESNANILHSRPPGS